MLAKAAEKLTRLLDGAPTTTERDQILFLYKRTLWWTNNGWEGRSEAPKEEE